MNRNGVSDTVCDVDINIYADYDVCCPFSAACLH